MWIGLVLVGVISIATNFALLRLIDPDPGTTERPARDQIGPLVTGAWALAVVSWGLVYADAVARGAFRAGIGWTAAAVVTLVAPTGARAVDRSFRTLVSHAREVEADRVYTAAGQAIHEAQNLSAVLGHHFDAEVDRLLAVLRTASDEAAQRRRHETRETLVAVERRRRNDTAPAFGNWTDSTRLWHTASIEWLVLLATLVLRAGIVGAAPALPSTLTAGVAPHPARDLLQAMPWATLTTWSVGLALCGPQVASIVMDRAPRVITFALESKRSCSSSHLR